MAGDAARHAVSKNREPPGRELPGGAGIRGAIAQRDGRSTAYILTWYPLWGGLAGAIGAELFLYSAPAHEAAAAFAAAVLWILVRFAERFAIGLSYPWVLNLAVGVCWLVALQRFQPSRVLPAAIAAHTISRAGAIGLAWVSRPAAAGFVLSLKVRTPPALLAMAQGVAAAFLGGMRAGLLLTAASYLVLRLLQEWCYKRRGGIDAAGFSGAQAALEVAAIGMWSVL